MTRRYVQCSVCAGGGCVTCEFRGWFIREIVNMDKITPKVERHPASARFHAILSELGSLHDSKQADYGTTSDPFANVRGSSEWGIEPWVGAMVRATDKVRRLQSFLKHGKLRNESVDDSLRDLAVYAIIALVLFEEGTPPK